jgi:hypothetical protein
MAKRKKIEVPEILDDSQDETASPQTDEVKPEVAAREPSELFGTVDPKEMLLVAPKESPKEVPKADGLPKVALRVFIASGGIRWDQMAGFKYYATRLKMGPLSIPEWRAAFNKFMKRPV